MVTITSLSEFTWDVVSCAPHAYWCENNGIPYKTVGAIGSKPFFYFSKDHEERGGRTSTNSYAEYTAGGCLTNEIYDEWPDLSQWLAVPYKENFKNDIFVYDKPLLIINNKYTEEWGKDPVNYIGADNLRHIVKKYGDSHQIIYIRPDGKDKGYASDYNGFYDFSQQEREALGQDVIYFKDLLSKYDYGFNDLQMMVHANADLFFSALGGNSTLSSCFGGINYVLYERGHINGHKGYYRNLSGCDIKLVKMDELKNVI